MRAEKTTGRAVLAALLVTAAMLSLYLHARLSVKFTYFNPADETGYFTAESAFQYRYARMVARGEPVPELDRDAQYPEGVRTRRELTQWMPYATGWAYRLLPAAVAPDFRWFVILLVGFFGCLVIPAVYAIGLRLTRSPPVALAAAAAYGLSMAARSNQIGNFEFESFALPMILGSLACLAAAFDAEERRPALWAALSGVGMACALASWHFTRFYLASLFLAAAYAAYRRRVDASALDRLRTGLGFLLAGAAAAGLLSAPLRESGLLVSPIMALGAGLWLALRFPKRAAAIVAATAAAVAALMWISHDASSYGHVYALLAAKLRFGLVRPADPAALSQEARLLWTGPFDSPDPGFLLFMFLPLALILGPRAAAAWKGEKNDAPAPLTGDLIDALLLLYLAGEIMVLRLTPFLACFLCLAGLRLPRRIVKQSWLLAGLVALAALEGFKTLAPASPFNPFLWLSAPFAAKERLPPSSTANHLAVLRWLNAVGGPDTPVLTHMGFSSVVLAYTRCPVILQPKFEAPAIRAKTAEFLTALYSDEKSFHQFCRKYGVRLFVDSINTVMDETPDGERYASGRMRLAPDSAAVLFHFHPERLARFRLVYENKDVRVFTPAPFGALPAVKPAGLPIYDLRRFSPSENPDGSLNLDVAGVVARMRLSHEKLLMSRLMNRMGRKDLARTAYEDAAAAWPLD
jgi:hypothetical protein